MSSKNTSTLREIIRLIEDNIGNYDKPMFYDENAPIYGIAVYPDKIIFSDIPLADSVTQPLKLSRVIDRLRNEENQGNGVYFGNEDIIRDVIEFKDSILFIAGYKH